MVFVRSQIVQRTQSPFDFGLPQEQQGEATGSGFVIDRAGTILTNAHVVNGATKVTVQFQNKQSVDAKVLGKDESTDLALLQVDPRGPQAHAADPRLVEGRAGRRSGHRHRQSLRPRAHPHHRRHLRRPAHDPGAQQLRDRRRAADRRADQPGQLRRPAHRRDRQGDRDQLPDRDRRQRGSQGSVGIGFAVPIDTAKQIIPDLKQSGRVDRGYLGIGSTTVDKTLKDLNLPVRPRRAGAVGHARAARPPRRASAPATSARRSTTTRSSSAATSSSRSPARTIRTSNDLQAAVADRKSGDKVKVTLWRGEQGQDRRGHARRAPEHGDQPALTTMRGVSTDAPRIKLCGITSRDDALLAVDAGAWAVGCILWPGSPRACDPAEAARIAAARAPARPRLRGVRQRAARPRRRDGRRHRADDGAAARRRGAGLLLGGRAAHRGQGDQGGCR